nr:PIN domain-containing protein [Maliibacterium massiliense]
MLKKLARGFITLLGAGLGVGVVALTYQVLIVLKVADPLNDLLPLANLAIFLAAGLVGGVIFCILAPRLMKWLMRVGDEMEQMLRRMSARDIASGSVGLVLGLIIAFFVSYLYQAIPIEWLQTLLTLVNYFLFGYCGIKLFTRRQDEFFHLFAPRRGKGGKLDMITDIAPKLLDTSVIIDGRIFDICKAGFLEGTIVIPNFVLQELQNIADSTDALRRNRGRRGLDVLKRIRKELDMPVRIDSTDYDDIDLVDAKLVRLAQDISAKIVTNDYNLNQVAQVQGVSVLNINELSNAVKPVLAAGEHIRVSILREGKEPHQGVAYLDDGTMVVVEEGAALIGQDTEAVVTSVLQTAAGRMIFAKPYAPEE